MIRRLGFTLVSCCALSAPIFAQTGGTISAGDVQFVRTPSSFDATPAADLKGLTSNLAQDHLFEHGWWFRVLGDSAETSLGVPDSEIYNSGFSLIDWNDVAGRGLFSAHEYAGVYDSGSVGVGDGGFLRSSLTVTNLSPTAELTIAIFHMADIDLDGSLLDSGALVEYPFLIQVSDPGGSFAHYLSPDWWRITPYIVRPFGVTSVREILNDGNLTDFDNTGLPFAAGDIGMGFQMGSYILPPLWFLDLTIYIGVNTSLRCRDFSGGSIFCDGFEAADSRFWSAVAPFSD